MSTVCISIITIPKMPRLEGFTMVAGDGPTLMSTGYTPNGEVPSPHTDPPSQVENVPSQDDILKQDPTLNFCKWLFSNPEGQKILELFAETSEEKAVDVMIVLTDTNALEDYPHWRYVEDTLKKRMNYRGPAQERWGYCYIQVQAENGLNQVHFTWSLVHVMEVLHTLFLHKHILMADHDACFVGLVEFESLLHFATRTQEVVYHANGRVPKVGVFFFFLQSIKHMSMRVSLEYLRLMMA